MKQFRSHWMRAALTRTIIGSAACAVAGLVAVSAFAQTLDGSQTKAERSLKAESKSNDGVIRALQQMAMDAESAQAAGDLKRAAELWGKLLSEDVDAIVRCRAHFSAGLCYSQLRDFESSIFHFKKGLEVATPESAAEIPQALFYLGYSQLELGRTLRAMPAAVANDSVAKQQNEKANELLTTSSKTFGRLQRRFPDFAGADQAAFFQAKAFELLGRLGEAVESYQSALSFDKPIFALDAQFGLATVLEQLGQSAEALKQYRSLNEKPDSFSEAQEPMLVESRFRAAELLMTLGDSSRNMGDSSVAAKEFADAFELYAAVADQDVNRPLVPLAIYGAAWSKLNSAVGENQVVAATEADQWFTRLIDAHPDHRLIADAMTGRGSARRLMGELSGAADDLDKVASGADSKPAREDARLELGLAYVKQSKWPEAIEVFKNLVQDFPNSPVADRYHYELAWAFESINPPMTDAAVEHFAVIAEKMPNSSFAAEAHFHLGSADYEGGQYDSAATHFAKVLNSDLPAKVIERASYQLGWAEYRLENYDAAADQFEQQLKVFPAGALSTDAKVMFAESQFQQDKHSDALQAYLVAKPAVDADGNIDPKMQMLTALHGAQSANESEKFDAAIQFAMPVTEANEIPEAYQADAWLEIGIAQAGKGNEAIAVSAWQKAAVSLSVTGARARCLLGESLAGQQQYLDALNQYKLVYFGFGGVDASDDVRPWQVFALYEAARLNQSLCQDAVGPALRQRVDEAIGQYERLLEHYGDHELADEAKRQLTKLESF